MSDFVFVNNDDQRYRTLQKGFNLPTTGCAILSTKPISSPFLMKIF